MDVVLNGITGSIGLRPTLSALSAGNTVALANKESLVAGGDLVTAAAKPGQLVPDRQRGNPGLGVQLLQLQSGVVERPADQCHIRPPVPHHVGLLGRQRGSPHDARSTARAAIGRPRRSRPVVAWSRISSSSRSSSGVE